jgi:hypothetical protein
VSTDPERAQPPCNCVADGCHAGCPAAVHTDIEGRPCGCQDCREVECDAGDQAGLPYAECCGNCGPGLCYVDQMTGEASEGWGWQR